MAKKYSFRKITKKSLIAMLCALSVTCTGLAAACAPEEEETPSTPAKEDTSLLKNGSFEYFDIPEDAIHLIKNVNDWSLGGESSVLSGIIGTSQKDWDALTADGLAGTLEYNYDLGSSDDNYIDYNSMRQRDMLYKDSYAALLEKDAVEDSLISYQGYENYFGIKDGKYAGKDVYFNEDDGEYYFDEEFTECIRYALIDNPETHYGSYSEKDGKYYLGNTEVYKDEDGNLYLDKDMDELVGNVLMIHNYSTDGNYNGIQQYYSSVTITLEANTAAEISLWVKTSDLKFDKGYDALDEQDKGAFIEVVQTVGGNSIDSFAIKNINTEKIIKYAESDGRDIVESNGWLQYTIYVNSCDFAASTIQLKLGLGRSGAAEKCTGYAFFDDVEVTKYIDLDETSYSEHEAQAVDCNLTDEEEDKIFNADRELREQTNTDKDFNNSYDFYYFIDLASEIGENSYNTIAFNGGTSGNVYAALTSEEDGNDSNKVYASATSSNGAIYSGFAQANTDLDNQYSLVKNMTARPVSNDLVGIFAADAAFNVFSGKDKDYSALLKDALTGENGITELPRVTDGNMLVILSSYGAAYTATVSDSAFNLTKNEKTDKDSYLIVSFWLKTSDMDGKTAATVKIYDKNDEDNYQTLTVDTTGVTSNFEKQKDIYNGWVECFFFVKNTVKYEADNKQEFAIDFSFGNTSIIDATSYDGGWAAIANLQTLAIDEDIYNLATSGSYCALFSFTADEDDNGNHKFDEATTTSDIKTEIANPSSYSGINGANSAISDLVSNPAYDEYNTNTLAGLINKEYLKNYDQKVLNALSTSFSLSVSNWDEVFGEDCYQPLIIINNLRAYANNVTANENNYELYYIEADDGDIVTADGRTFKSAKGTEWSEDETYYSIAGNYGFAGTTQTISSDSYTTVSVRVMVSSGATAYIYLVDGSNTKEVLSYSTPAYTFWYDEEGNVLDTELDPDWKEKEHREHIVYTLRGDGLYEDKDSKVYANLYNLIENYRNYKFEHNTFYDVNGNAVSFDNLVNGETYYSDEECTKLADHYLVNSANKRIYECVDGVYYYLEEGVRTTEVNNFDDAYARYANEGLNEKYAVSVGYTEGKWVTVNFHIHTGSESISYRLEVWSGARDEVGLDNTSGAVAFDYSAYSLSSESYSSVISQYEEEIIAKYHELLKDHTEVWANENIAYYEQKAAELVESGDITQAQLDAVKNTYSAEYYTYTLYDSAAYLPFNANTAADGETGYSYSASDFGETLAYLTYTDKELNSINVFADYSAVDQSISMNTASADDEDTDDEDSGLTGDVWLYISSIILVVVLLITLIAILVRNFLKKKKVTKGAKNRNKNVYRQRDRYIRKLHLVKNEDAVEETPAEEPAEVTEEPAETVEEPAETVDTPAETVEEPAETVDTPAETVEEPAPVEEPEASDNSDNNTNNQD